MTTANTLADRAVLVNLSISQWSAKKTDKKVNREVAANHGSDANMGNYRKCLIAKDAIDNVSKITAAAREEHYRLSLPWRDGGDRILSSQAYFSYSEKVRKMETDFENAVSEFCANYPQYVEDARAKLNGLFDSKDYPDVARIRSKFSFKFEVLPVPVADDLRVNLGNEETARIKQQIEQDSADQIARAMSDIWQRMREVIAAMAERLKLYKVNPNGTVEHPFRDTLVTNISDLVSILPLLNLTGDPNITQFAQEMSAGLTRYSPEQLRETEYARQDTAARADEILSKMAAFIA